MTNVISLDSTRVESDSEYWGRRKRQYSLYVGTGFGNTTYIQPHGKFPWIKKLLRKQRQNRK